MSGEAENKTVVASLTRARIARRFGVVEEVRAYWEALRGGHMAPHRRAFDPRGIAGALDSAFLADRPAPGVARLRVAGRAIARLAGTEPANMPLDALFVAEARPVIARAVERCFQSAMPAMLPLQSRGGFLRRRVMAHLAIFPLMEEDGSVTRVLGVLAVAGDPARAGVGLEIAQPQAGQGRPHPAAGATTAAGARQPSEGAGHGHLRLVHDAGR